MDTVGELMRFDWVALRMGRGAKADWRALLARRQYIKNHYTQQRLRQLYPEQGSPLAPRL